MLGDAQSLRRTAPWQGSTFQYKRAEGREAIPESNSSACCRSLVSNQKIFLSQYQWQIVTTLSVQARSQKTTFSVCLKNTALCRHRGNSVTWSRTRRGVWQRNEGSEAWCEAIPEVKQRQRSCTTSHPSTLLPAAPFLQPALSECLSHWKPYCLDFHDDNPLQKANH